MGKRMRRKRDKVWGKSKEKLDINASFRSRHGAISVDLEVVARDPHTQPAHPSEKVPARVFASNNHGRITLNVVRTARPPIRDLR